MHGFFMFVAVSCRDKSLPVLLRIKHFLKKERLKSKSFHLSVAFKKRSMICENLMPINV